MALAENGDVITIKVGAPIVGLVGLTDFIGQDFGEGENAVFEKAFRYSSNGINWSDWVELTTDNIQAVDISPSDVFRIEYRYELISGGFNYESTELFGQFTETVNGENYNKSLFSDWFSLDDNEVLLWAINVTDKLYQKGIVPDFIERGSEDSQYIDADYVNFWRSVSIFFSLFVKLSRIVGGSLNDPRTAYEYLKQKNAFQCSERASDELFYVISNYYDEIRKRGTDQVFKAKSAGGVYDGEFLRFICKEPDDEFIFSPVEPHKAGWNLDSCSPIYKGTSQQINSNKSYEDSKDIVDLTKYPSNGGAIVQSGGKGFYRFGTGEGIFFDSENSKLINIDPEMDYELTFYLSADSANSIIDLGFQGYNSSYNSINFEKPSNNSDENISIESISLPRSGEFYFIRIILWNFEKQISAVNNLTNIGVGENLRFKEAHKFICPYIKSELGVFDLWDLKMRPLHTDFSTGFLQVNNWVNCWFKNRNNDYSKEEIVEISERYLLPYKNIFKAIEI